MSRPVHFEICTEQPAKLAEFYKTVLDWEIATWDGNQAYWLARTGEEGSPGIDGAIMHNHFPQAVINTIEVASLEEALQKVEANGGRKVHGPNEIPDIGLHVYCEDPEGIIFGLIQAFQRDV